MYNNIGNKIKTLAKVLFFIGAIASIIAGIVLLAVDMILLGLLLLLLVPILLWISSWTLYGFGELICTARDIERNTRGQVTISETESKVVDKRIGQIEKLRAQGLITEEEYQKAISKDN